MEIPAEVRKNLINVHGDVGRKWLKDLPRVIKHYEEKWQLTVGTCFSEACFNFVARAVLVNGQNVVLKCGIPDKGFHDEMTALQYFKGHGAVQLLNADENVGIMLLEQLTPGVLLEAHANLDEATAFAVNVMQKIHRPISGANSYSTLHDWFLGFEQLTQQFSKQTNPFPKNLVDSAQQISHDLLTSMGEAVLLHGDLHYANIILSEQRGYCAIDPKGVMGEVEFEIPLPRLTAAINKAVLQKRLAAFIEISGFDKQRVLSWAFAKVVLAAWWSFEDSGEIWPPFLEAAFILAKIR